MKRLADLKDEMVNKVFSDAEIESLMIDAGYIPFDCDLSDGTIAVFTDGKKLAYVKGFRDVDGNAEVVGITTNNNIKNGDQTKVEPFRTYEDLEAVLNYLKERGQWNHWLACRLMVGLGRRSGDTLNLRWCDIFRDKECTRYYERCMKLKEEKTGKIIAPHITEYVQMSVEEYLRETGTDPSMEYVQKIFSIGTPAVRAAVKKAVEAVGIEYPISLHSFRKTYGNWTYKIHRNEGICLEIIRGMFGHNDTGITRLYIDQTNEDAKRYANDLSDYLLKKEDGTAIEINNSPNVTIKAESLRDILSLVFDAGVNGKDKFETINSMITRIEKEGF